MAEKQCAHESCNCGGAELRQDGYCSDSCKQGKEQDGSCGCGHPDCG